MPRIEFTVFGEPVPQGRPRFTTCTRYRNGSSVNQIHAYDPERSRHYKTLVQHAAMPYKLNTELLEALSLTVKIYRPIPKSFSKKKAQLAEDGILRPVTKPDLDNYIKAIMDALNSIIWKDDSQVVDFGQSGKWYSQKPRVEIIIQSVE